jgi:membrane protein
MAGQHWWALIKETGAAWWEDKVPRLAASLAFFTILSASPLLVIVMAISGMVFGKKAVEGQLVEELRTLIGDQGGQAIQTMIASAQGPGSGLAMVVGVILLLIGASGVFAELQDSLNTIWNVTPKPGRGVWGIIQDRFLSLVMVFGIGFLLLVTLVLSTGLAALTRVAGLEQTAALGQVMNFILSFGVITVLFAITYKLLPDVKIGWRDVWVGAVVTAFLFTVGKLLIGLYLGHASLGSQYGAAGSVVVFVVWVYYSGQILLLGAEFTKVYAKHTGSRIKPAENAMPLTSDARAKQGMARSPVVEGAGR